MRCVLLGFALWAAGCGGRCETLEEEAAQSVLAELDNPTPCESAEDCTLVSIAGSCFDACERAAHFDDVEDIVAAINQAEITYCSEYRCNFQRPPCERPPNALCLNRVCTPGGA